MRSKLVTISLLLAMSFGCKKTAPASEEEAASVTAKAPEPAASPEKVCASIVTLYHLARCALLSKSRSAER